MLEKKYVFGLVLAILSFSVIAQDASVDVLENVGNKRCVQNGKCEYFEDEFSCEVDCNIAALQKQRTNHDNALSNTRTNAQIAADETSGESKRPGSKLIIFSALFIALILILVVSLYFCPILVNLDKLAGVCYTTCVVFRTLTW